MSNSRDIICIGDLLRDGINQPPIDPRNKVQSRVVKFQFTSDLHIEQFKYPIMKKESDTE